jgi:wobble nucleotide-excising tRNase
VLKRIKKIENIGRFKNCQGSQALFAQVTYIYGRNTYGKTTISDLLASFGRGSIDAIKARKTLPIELDAGKQSAELTFLADGDPKETTARFTGERWDPIAPGNLTIRVFDDGFYHTHVFAARSFTRDTKVNFSSFVLGERGVLKAKEIAERNKRKGEATREKSKLHKTAFSEKSDRELAEFIALEPTESIEELEEKVANLRATYQAFNSQIMNADKIQARGELSEIRWVADLSATLQELSKCLEGSLESHHEEAKKALSEHIQATFAEPLTAENWIRTGLTQNKGEKCQFCGQLLNDDAHHLLNVYRESFNAAYGKHEASVVSVLDSAIKSLRKNRTADPTVTLHENDAFLRSYPELEENGQYISQRAELIELASRMKECLAALMEQQAEIAADADKDISAKRSNPHRAINRVVSLEISELEAHITQLVIKYNDIAKVLNGVIAAFKKSCVDPARQNDLVKLEGSGKAEARKLDRLRRKVQCEEYAALGSEITRLGNEIAVLQRELADDQSAYVDAFFDRINKYFKSFGSRDFTLSKGSDLSGHTPVYYLKVKLKNADIAEKDLDHVFSESDRRALALSVFWAGIDGLPDPDRRRAIVVLDDPVTSFDLHRVTAVHKEFAAMADRVRQIIVFSHFEKGICNFLTTYRKSKEVALLEISSGSSKLERLDVEEFLQTEHEKARNRILRFIGGEGDFNGLGDLRVYLEYEIAHRFAKQLVGIDEETLSSRIEGLRLTGAVSEATAKEADSWREILNPAHHDWIDNDIEDQRHTAAEFMDFVYHKLVPIQTNVGRQIDNEFRTDSEIEQLD